MQVSASFGGGRIGIVKPDAIASEPQNSFFKRFETSYIRPFRERTPQAVHGSAETDGCQFQEIESPSNYENEK